MKILLTYFYFSFWGRTLKQVLAVVNDSQRMCSQLKAYISEQVMGRWVIHGLHGSVDQIIQMDHNYGRVAWSQYVAQSALFHLML